MNDVALGANDVLRNDVMLRINDVALRANGSAYCFCLANLSQQQTSIKILSVRQKSTSSEVLFSVKYIISSFMQAITFQRTKECACRIDTILPDKIAVVKFLQFSFGNRMSELAGRVDYENLGMFRFVSEIEIR